MNIYLDDTHVKENLIPFSLTRHVADINIGIFSIREKWEKLLQGKASLSNSPENSILINAALIPTIDNFQTIIDKSIHSITIEEDDSIKILKYPWHIFQLNDWALRMDFKLINKENHSQVIPETVQVVNANDVFISEDAQMAHCILNASTGPIYIAKGAQIMEGAMIRGPFSLGENGVVKMGAKIYGATSIGKQSVVGGEIKNAVIFDYSNKAHDGYLGDSVIGSWCNLGAGTTNSNVKNNFSSVKMQLSPQLKNIEAGNKAGLIMGDYSKSAINTSFNTGTVVGVSCNIFGNEMPPKFVPNFTWGNETYYIEKAIIDIQKWKHSKNQEITKQEIDILKNIYQNLNHA
jgi:UDP-N-acetylglucosamine diphosphorylase/glucosamine-1-phosphate N-acetyltransferase